MNLKELTKEVNFVNDKVARSSDNFTEFHFTKGCMAVTKIKNKYSFNITEKVCTLSVKELNEFIEELKKMQRI